MSGSLSFTQVSTAGSNACGVTVSGVVYCWGGNLFGQLGVGSTSVMQLTPVPLVGGLTFSSVSAGGSHTCGVTTTGGSYSWGSNRFGELGATTNETCLSSPCSTSPALVFGGLTFKSVSAGGGRTCAITADGEAYCWGSNSGGQLGTGDVMDRSAPAKVAGGLSFAAVSPGGTHTCGVTLSGAAYCWGRNDFGQLGDGSNLPRTTPVLVSGGLSFMSVTLGTNHSCGLTPAGVGYCWGRDTRGQLGVGGASEICLQGTEENPCTAVPERLRHPS